MAMTCTRCGSRPARDQYHLWHPELCAVCVEEIKHPSMRRSVQAENEQPVSP